MLDDKKISLPIAVCVMIVQHVKVNQLKFKTSNINDTRYYNANKEQKHQTCLGGNESGEVKSLLTFLTMVLFTSRPF